MKKFFIYFLIISFILMPFQAAAQPIRIDKPPEKGYDFRPKSYHSESLPTCANGQVATYNSTTKNWDTCRTLVPGTTVGDLTESTSSVFTITGGTNAVVGTGTTIQVKAASAAQNGYLSSTHWAAFNAKEPAITACGASNVIMADKSCKQLTTADFLAVDTWRVFYSNASKVITELALGSNGQYLRSNGASNIPSWDTPGTGTLGDVIGPASATNEAVAIYSGTTGKLIKNSGVTIDSGGNISTAGAWNGTYISMAKGGFGLSTATWAQYSIPYIRTAGDNIWSFIPPPDAPSVNKFLAFTGDGDAFVWKKFLAVTNETSLTQEFDVGENAWVTKFGLSAPIIVGKGGTGLATVADGSILATSAANTFTAVTSTSGLKRLVNNAGDVTWNYGDTVNVLDYGATGDGTHDDTPHIQAAIDAAGIKTSVAPSVVFFPSGIYQITSALTITKPIMLKGSGIYNSIIRTGSATLNMIEIDNIYAIGIENLYLSSSVTRTAGACIYVTGDNTGDNRGNQASHFSNLMMVGYNGIVFYRAHGWHITGSTIYYTNIGVTIENNGWPDWGNNEISGTTIVGPGSGSSPGTGIYHISSGGTQIRGSTMMFGDIGYLLNPSTECSVGTGLILLEGNSFENAVYGVVLERTSGAGIITGVVINANEFAGLTGSSIIQTSSGWLSELVITGNTMGRYNLATVTTTHIHLDGVNNGIISGNSIRGGAGAEPAGGIGIGIVANSSYVKIGPNKYYNLTTNITNLSTTSYIFDVPGDSYSGQAGKYLQVNSGETALQFATGTGSPGGSSTHIQYKDAGGNFAGSANAIFDVSTGLTTLSTLNLTGTTFKINSTSTTGTSTINFNNGSANIFYQPVTVGVDGLPNIKFDERTYHYKVFSTQSGASNDFGAGNMAVNVRIDSHFEFPTWTGSEFKVGHNIWSYLNNNLSDTTPELVGIESWVYATDSDKSKAGMYGFESQLVKYKSTGAAANMTESQMLGLDAVLISTVDPSSYHNGSGFRAYSGNIDGAHPNAVQQYAGFVATGNKGWKYPFLAVDTDLTTAFFSVNAAGLTWSKTGFLMANQAPLQSLNSAGNVVNLVYLNNINDVYLGAGANKVVLGSLSNDANPIYLRIGNADVNLSGAISVGTILAAQATNVLSAVTSSTGTKILTNTAGNITWEIGGSMTYPGAGIANSTGSAWGTSYTTTGTGTVVALSASPTFTGTVTTAALNATTLTTTVAYGGSPTAAITMQNNTWLYGGTQPLIKYDGSATVYIAYGATATDIGGGTIILGGQTISFGINDSCGTGYRCIKVPNI